MANDIVQTIAEARFDARSLSEFVFKPASFMVARRLAPSVHTLQYYVNRFETIDSSFTQALNTANAAAVTANAAAVTATNNAVGLVDSVTNNAYQQVSSAIAGVAIDANLVTDALVTTSIRKPNQVVRTQADKNQENYYIEDWGGKGDGVTDNYPILMSMIEDIVVRPQGSSAIVGHVPIINFGHGVYYFSEEISLHGVVHLKGETSAGASTFATELLFAEGKNGIIVNRQNTDGQYGSSELDLQSDGSRFIGLAVKQKNYIKSSVTVSEYNPDIGMVMLMDVVKPDNRRFPIDGTSVNVVAYNKRQDQEVFRGTIRNARRMEGLIEVDALFKSIQLGSLLTGNTSGAVATVGYISNTQCVYVFETLEGTFQIGEEVLNESGEALKIVHSLKRGCYAANITGTGTLEATDILTRTKEDGFYGSAFVLRARASFEHCNIRAFPMNGVSIITDGTSPGNANAVEMRMVTIRNMGHHGLMTFGGDSNAGTFYGLNCTHIGGYGIFDSSFLGNHYFSCHTSATGAGPYFSAKVNNFSVFLGCYSEAGQTIAPLPTPISTFGRDTTVIGGDHGGLIRSNRTNPYGKNLSSTLIGARIELGKAMYQSNAFDAGGVTRGTMVFESNSDETITLVKPRDANVNLGPGIGFTQSPGEVSTGKGLEKTQKSGGIYSYRLSNRYGANRIVIKSLLPLKYISTILSNLSLFESFSKNSRYMSVVENGNLVRVEVVDPGESIVPYSNPLILECTGEYAGAVVEAYVLNGRVVKTKIITPPDLEGSLTNTSPVESLNITSYDITAGTDNHSTLGTAQVTFKDIYTSSGLISTSDGRYKTDIRQIDDSVLDAWGEVNFVTFKWIKSVEDKGDLARNHIGVVAQQIKEVFEGKGLDATDYGLICFDEWKDGYKWSIRADQCMFLESAYQRREIKRIIERLELLEAK